MAYETSVSGLPFMEDEELINRIDEDCCVLEIVEKIKDQIPCYATCMIRRTLEERVNQLKGALAIKTTRRKLP